MKANPCTVCGGTDLNLVDGFYYCVECGTQDETVRETLIETTQLADGTFAQKNKQKMRRAKDGVKMSREWYKWHTYNFILLGLTEELEKLGAGPDFKMKVLWVWTRYIKEFQVKEELVDVLGDKEETNSKDSESDDDRFLNNNNKDKKKKPKEEMSFPKNIKRVTKCVLISILYAALNLDRSELQLTHLLKYVNSDELSLFHYRKLIPEELKMRDVPDCISFVRGTNHIQRQSIRARTLDLFKTLGLGTPLVPDLRKIIDNYVIELCLPDAFKEIVFSLMNFVPCDYLGNFTKDMIRVPDFECVAMSYVLVALKMVFGLDCDYEIKLSDVADQINMSENHVRCYKIGMSVNESSRLFSFREWCRYLRFRKVMLSKFHLPLAKQFDIDVNDYVFMEQSIKTQVRKIELLDEVTMDILKKIPNEDTPAVIPLTQFPPTLTPMSTYTDIIAEHIQDTESKLLLSEDFTKYSLKYVLEDIELPAEVNEIIQNSLSECNKTVNRSVNDTIIYRTAEMNMVFVKFCENKNWLKTKPPTTDHITVGQTDAECIEAATNNGVVNIDDSVVDVSDSLYKETELNSEDDVNDLNETSSRYDPSLIFPEEDPKSDIHDLNITDSYHNRHNSDNTKDKDVGVVSDLNLLREEDIDKNIFDDTFADIKDEKNEVFNDINNIDNTGINNIDDSGINNTVFEFGIPNGDISQHNASFVVGRSNLSVAKFDPDTFNRENVVKELVISECKTYKIVVPDAFKEGYKKIRDKKVKLLHVGAGEEAPKRRAKRLIPAGDTRSEVEKLLEAYNLQLQNDVIEEVSQNVRSLVQDLENRYNELNELTEDIKDEEHIDNENIKENTIDKLDNELDCEQTETLENVSEDDIEIGDDEKSVSGDPKFDENTHDIRQLYLKFEKEFGIDEVIKIDDAITENILLKGVQNKHGKPTTIEEIPIIDSETHESEPEVTAVDLDESPMLQEIEDQSLEELEPLIKDSERFKNSKYWCRHYYGDFMTRNYDYERIRLDFELNKNCSRSFYFVLHECAAVLHTSAFTLYREMQRLETAIIARYKHGDVSSNLLLETESTSELSGLPERYPPPRPPYGSVADQDKTDSASSLEKDTAPKRKRSRKKKSDSIVSLDRGTVSKGIHDDSGWYPKQKIPRSKDKSTRPKRSGSAVSLEDQPLSQRKWSREKKSDFLVSQDGGIILKEKRSRKKIPNSVVSQDEGTVPEVGQSISQRADSPVTQDKGTAPKRKRSRKKRLDSDEGAVPKDLGQRADSALDQDKGTAPTRKRSRKKKLESMLSQDKGTAPKRSRKKKSEYIVSQDESTVLEKDQSLSQRSDSAVNQDKGTETKQKRSRKKKADFMVSQDEGTVPKENQMLCQTAASAVSQMSHDEGTLPEGIQSPSQMAASAVSQMSQYELILPEGIQSPSQMAASTLSQDEGTVLAENQSLSQMTDSVLGHDKGTVPKRIRSRNKKSDSVVIQDESTVLEGIQSPSHRADSNLRQISQDECMLPHETQSLSQGADSAVSQDKLTAPKRKRSRKKKSHSTMSQDVYTVLEGIQSLSLCANSVTDSGEVPSQVSHHEALKRNRSLRQMSDSDPSQDEGNVRKRKPSLNQWADSATRPYEGTLDSEAGQFRDAIPKRGPQKQGIVSVSTPVEGTVLKWIQSLSHRPDSARSPGEGSVSKRGRPRKRAFDSVSSLDEDSLPRRRRSLSQRTESARSPGRTPSPDRKRLRKQSQPKRHRLWSKEGKSVGSQDHNTEPSLLQQANSVASQDECTAKRSQLAERGRPTMIVKVMRMAIKDIQTTDSVASQDRDNEPSLKQRADSVTSLDDCTVKRSQPAKRGRPRKIINVLRRATTQPAKRGRPKNIIKDVHTTDSVASQDHDNEPSLKQRADSVTSLDDCTAKRSQPAKRGRPRKIINVLRWATTQPAKRGRPKKIIKDIHTTDSVASQDHDNEPSLKQRADSVTSLDDCTAKRSQPAKRGRPRKIINVLRRATTQPAKRGRPRKIINVLRRATTQPAKRGRPRKIINVLRRATTQPAKRGRPKKIIKDIHTTDSVASQDYDNEPSLKQRADSVTSLDDCTAKRSQPAKRGRPKKSATTLPAKRGRPPKHATMQPVKTGRPNKIVKVTRMALNTNSTAIKSESVAYSSSTADESESIADTNPTAIKSESVADSSSTADEIESIADTNSTAIKSESVADSSSTADEIESIADTNSTAIKSESVADSSSTADETESITDIISISDETISVADESDSVADTKSTADESESIVRVNQTSTTQPTNRRRPKKNATTLPNKRGRPPKNATNQPAKRGRPKKNVKRGRPSNIVKDTRIAPTQPPQRGRPPKNATIQPAKRGRPKKNETKHPVKRGRPRMIVKVTRMVPTQPPKRGRPPKNTTTQSAKRGRPKKDETKQPVKSGLPRMVVKLTRINFAKVMLKRHNESVDGNSTFIAENIDSITESNSNTDKGESIADINSTADKSEAVADTKSIADKSKSIAEINTNVDKSDSIADTNSTAGNSESVVDTNSTADKSESDADTNSTADNSESDADTNSTAGKSEFDADTNSTADKSESIADNNSTADKSESIADNNSNADKSESIADNTLIADKSEFIADNNTIADKSESIADNNSIADKSESIADESESDADTNSIVDKSESIADTNSIADKNESIADTNSITDKSESIADTNSTADKSESDADTNSTADNSESDADTNSTADKSEFDADTNSTADKSESIADINSTADKSESIADNNSNADKSESIADNTLIADKSEFIADNNTIADKSESIADNNSIADKSESIADESESDADTNSIVDKSESIADTNSIADKNESIADTNSITDKSESIADTNSTADKTDSIADTNLIADKSESDADTNSIVDKSESIADTNSIADKNESIADTNSIADKTDSIADINLIADKSESDADSNTTADKSESIADTNSTAEKSDSIADNNSIADKSESVADTDSISDKIEPIADTDSIADKAEPVTDNNPTANESDSIKHIFKKIKLSLLHIPTL